MDYTTLTPEQAAKAARAETLKEIVNMCKELKAITMSNERYFAYNLIENNCHEKLNAIQ